MLQATTELLKYLNSESKTNGTIVEAYARVIIKLGGRPDAEAIFDQYMADPANFYYNLYLIEIIKKWGDLQFAERLFTACFENGRLKNEAITEPLELLGSLKYEPAKPVLAYYVFNATNYYLNRSAVFGLLNFNCDDIESQLIAEIKATYGKNLFKEFVPALVSKVKDKTEILEALYDLGNETASCDCNAGILLGFSLCGQAGYPWFKKALFNANWEADSRATGTLTFAYKGLLNLNISFLQLLEEVKEKEDKEEFKYALKVFLALLNARVNDETLPLDGQEPLTLLFQHLFAWEDGSKRNNLTDLAATAGLEDDAEEIEGNMGIALRIELMDLACNKLRN